MEKTDRCYGQYVQILREELLPAMGCTEPIAVAYAAAKARETLGKMPERVIVEASGNIIKNVKSVVVPNTGGLKGIPAAAAAGAAAGDAAAELQVLASVTPEQVSAIGDFLAKTPIELRHADTPHIFDIAVSVFSGGESAYVRITDFHTNIVCIRRNDETLYEKTEDGGSGKETLTDRSCMSVERIVDFADSVDPDDVRELLQKQIDCNMAIAEEGLTNSYGANIGKTLLKGHEGDIS